MQAGSLVTPRWNNAEMTVAIIKLVGDFRVVSAIKELPVFGQIYTISHIRKCSCCNNLNCRLEEIQIFEPITLERIGLPSEFYVEVDPPAHEVIAEVNEILQSIPA